MSEEEIDKMADNFVNTQDFTKVYSVARKAECGAFWKYGFLAGLKAQTKWHKVSEELPTEEKQYLLKFKDGTIDVLYVGIDGNLEPFIVTRECFNFYKDVEKWCEIPEE